MANPMPNDHTPEHPPDDTINGAACPAAMEAEGAEVSTTVAQVVATPAALDLIARLHQLHGRVMFHQSGGCCDGSAPMCFAQGDFVVGDRDRLLGHIGGAPFYISAPQFEYWQHTQLTIDVVAGRGGMFSLEGPIGLRFLVRSRLYDEREWAWLEAAGKVQPVAAP